MRPRPLRMLAHLAQQTFMGRCSPKFHTSAFYIRMREDNCFYRLNSTWYSPRFPKLITTTSPFR